MCLQKGAVHCLKLWATFEEMPSRDADILDSLSWQAKISKSHRLQSSKNVKDELRQDAHTLLRHFKKRAEFTTGDTWSGLAQTSVITKPSTAQGRQRRPWPLPADKTTSPAVDDEPINPIARAVITHISDKYVVRAHIFPS